MDGCAQYDDARLQLFTGSRFAFLGGESWLRRFPESGLLMGPAI